MHIFLCIHKLVIGIKYQSQKNIMTILSEGKNIQKIKSMGIYMSGDLYIVLPEPLNEINLRGTVT